MTSLLQQAAHAPALRHARTLRQDLRHLYHFLVKDEWQHGMRLTAPALVLRGYNSVRAYQYPDPPSRRDGYVSDLAYIRRVPGMNPAAVKLDLVDKVRFAEVLRTAGLRDSVPRTYATVVDGVLAQSSDADGPVVAKPAGGSRGRGLSISPDLATAVAHCPPQGSFILQEHLVQDEFRRQLYAGSLNTLRVQVIRLEPGAEPHVATVVQRIGRDSTAPVDNFSSGALAARVGQADGRLTYAVANPQGRQRQTWDVHPDSGARIAGATATGIGAAVELARAAMRVWPTAVNVGWDIAVCGRGPVLVEGNASWPNFGLLQSHGPITGDPVVRRWCEQWGLL